jgi:flagellar motor switch protein FliM
VNETTGQPLLSAEETAALLDVMRSSDKSFQQVQRAEIGSPERYLRGAVLHADQCARAVSHQFSKLAIRYSGSQLAAEDLPTEIVPYKMVAATFSRGSIAAFFKTRETGFALVMLGPSLVAFLLDRRLGAPLDTERPSQVSPRHALSLLELRLIEPFAITIAETFFDSWCKNSRVARFERLIPDIESLPVIADFEPLLQVRLRIPSPYCAPDTVTIALSSAAARDTLPREKTERGVSTSPEERARLIASLREVTVKTVAILGEMPTTLGAVLALKVGDVIRLDNAPAQPLKLHVRGQAVAMGVPLVQYGNMAMQILDIVKEV